MTSEKITTLGLTTQADELLSTTAPMFLDTSTLDPSTVDAYDQMTTAPMSRDTSTLFSSTAGRNDQMTMAKISVDTSTSSPSTAGANDQMTITRELTVQDITQDTEQSPINSHTEDTISISSLSPAAITSTVGFNNHEITRAVTINDAESPLTAAPTSRHTGNTNGVNTEEKTAPTQSIYITASPEYHAGTIGNITLATNATLIPRSHVNSETSATEAGMITADGATEHTSQTKPSTPITDDGEH